MGWESEMVDEETHTSKALIPLPPWGRGARGSPWDFQLGGWRASCAIDASAFTLQPTSGLASLPCRGRIST